MSYNMDYSSVDLTEDEDSRDTTCDVSENSQLPYYSYSEVNGNTPRLKTLSPSAPPPLTPICEINSLRNQRFMKNQHRAPVPQLKRILMSSGVSGPPGRSQPVSNYQSGSVGVQSYQDKFMAYHGNFTKSPVEGKEWTIKKDGKLYKIVIPHNVMPALNQSNGSVIVNVPEVGPIMLKINPYFKESTVSELQPFSLNFDEIMESSTEPVQPVPSIPASIPASIPEQNLMQLISETDPLYDPRFCWVQPKYKHYPSSFKLNFNGFSKADMIKSRRCVRNFTLGMKKLENLFSGKKHETSKKSTKNINKNDGHTQDQSNLQHNVLTKKFNSDWLVNSTNDISFEDVFIPNVVINTDSGANDNQNLQNSSFKNQINNKHKRKRISSPVVQKQLSSIVKPCVIRVVKDKSIENLIQMPDMTNSITISKKYVSLNKHKNILSKIISTESQFKTEMAFTKPLLIINEFNVHNVSFNSKFIKNNVVYSVTEKKFPKKLLENNDFLKAIKYGQVKLIDCSLLVRYLNGEIGPVHLAQ